MTFRRKHLNTRFKVAAALPVLLALSACGSSSDSVDDLIDAAVDETEIDDGIIDEGIGDDGIIDEIEDGDIAVTGGPGSCPIVGNLTPVELAPGECQISGQLTEDAELTADQTWFLEGGLQIGSPEVAATLNIQAGTQIRGDNVDVTDYVLVYPGSALRANGTGASPVQFLSDDDNVDGSGEWGGVFLRGFNGLSTTGTQGSNLLDYTVVAEAGAAVEVMELTAVQS